MRVIIIIRIIDDDDDGHALSLCRAEFSGWGRREHYHQCDLARKIVAKIHKQRRSRESPIDLFIKTMEILPTGPTIVE